MLYRLYMFFLVSDGVFSFTPALDASNCDIDLLFESALAGTLLLGSECFDLRNMAHMVLQAL